MSRARVIPSLDGLRALAVLSVILFHCETPFLDGKSWLTPLRNGALGVTCFFVISGFLITKLLLDEQDEYRRIDLKRFYIRRAFRIFPPYYVYLLFVGALALLHVVHISLESYLVAVSYLRDYLPHPNILLLNHTWSLSLEEQFYLVWPICLWLFRPRICLRIAAIVILLSPVIRGATYVLVPGVRDHINFMLHTRLDAIMVGALSTLAQHQGAFRKALDQLKKPKWLIPVVLYFALQPALTARYGGAFSLLVGFSLDALGCGIVVIYTTQNPDSLLGRLLNLRWLRHVGIISYSLYLWQQPFTGSNTRWFPLNLLGIFAVAEASYWWIERPSLKLRNRLSPSRSKAEEDPVQREDLLEIGQLTTT